MTNAAVTEAREAYRAAEVGHSTFQERDAAMAAWREAVHATESTDERCLRLGVMAADKDAEAERHLLAAADAAGCAAGRRLAGNDDEYARSFDREAAHCTALQLKAEAEAERLRSQCAALRRAQAYAEDVVAMVSTHSSERAA